jgi:hypothetical protein
MTRSYFSRLPAALGFVFAALSLLPPASSASAEPTTPGYRNPALAVDERVADLLGRMTL